MAKLSLYFRAGGAYAAFPRIEAQFGDRYGLTVGGETFIDVMPKTTNKGLGLTQLGAALNITPAEMMAFGDTNNDIQMMQTVKYGVLVANATPNMAAYADYRTASNLDLGVLKAIDGVLAGQLPAHV